MAAGLQSLYRDTCPLPGNMHCTQQQTHFLQGKCCFVRSALLQSYTSGAHSSLAEAWMFAL